MNLSFHLILLVFFSLNVFSQDKHKVLHEFGAKAGVMYLSNSSRKGISGTTLWEHEFLYRLHFKKNALRLMFSSWNKRKDFAAFGPPRTTSHMTIDSQKEFFGSVGYQRHMQGKTKNLYWFSDIHYTHFICSGVTLPPFNTSYTAKCLRVGTEHGIGYKFQFFDCLNISPEIFLNFVYSRTNFVYTSVSSNMMAGYSRAGNNNVLASVRLFISFELKSENGLNFSQ